MIESPKNFIEQFQNFIEHIAGVMKTFLTKEVADNYYLGKTDKAVSATKATQDANGNVIPDTYATKTEVTTGLAGKLGKTEKASSASTADAVAWTGVSGKPNFATVATSGSYDDLKDKPSIPNSTVSQVFNSKVSSGTVTITGLTPYKPCFILLRSLHSADGSRHDTHFNLIGGAVINGEGKSIGYTQCIIGASVTTYPKSNIMGSLVIVPVGTTLSFSGEIEGTAQFIAYQ